MTTARTIVSSALKKIHVLGAGESMSADDAQDGFEELNRMLDTWSADGAVIFTESIDSVSLSAGDDRFTMGTSGDINTTRPVRIRSVTCSDGVDEWQLEFMGMELYSQIPNKTQQGEPWLVYWDNGYPLITFILWNVPSTTLTAKVYSEKKLTSFASLDTVLSMPPGYEDALIYNLAVRRSADYEREALPSVIEMAKSSLETIQRANRKNDDNLSAVDPMLSAVSGSGEYDIYSGRWW